MAGIAFLNPVFGPLLKIPPAWAIIIVSVLATVLVTLVYKWTTDQKLMKELRDKTKKLQDEMKEHGKDTKKLLKVQKELMDVNLKYMMHSFKPTLYTLIPLLLIFAWLNAALAYEPIKPGETFATAIVFENGIKGNVTLIAPQKVRITSSMVVELDGNPDSFTFDGKEKKGNAATWALNGDAGEYVLEYLFNEKKYTKEVSITENQEYYSPRKIIDDKVAKEIYVGNRTLVVMNLWGIKLSWFWAYILISVVLSLLLRKLMNIY